MCGICGFATVQRVFERSRLDRMVDAMIHRGPDDRGVAYFHRAGLGFRRLSIIDLSGGHQPLTNENGQIVAVVNGEIYNYQELRRELLQQGHRFRSDSDAEVVPHLYESGGMEAVSQKLRGMFAAAIWDRRDQSMHLIRDHFGIKPLYYSVTPQGLFFASDIRSLLAGEAVDPAMDRQALWHYLTFQYVPDPRTLLRGVQKLPPAHYLTFRCGRPSLTRYWQLEYRPDPAWKLPELAEAIHKTLQDSVKRHLVSDVPVGAYLSSGIDSASVVSFVRQQQPVDTFSVGFADNPGDANELHAARETAKHLDTQHHEIVIAPEEYMELLPRIVASQEDPVADPSAPALYFLAREARRHVTVVLSGEGSDELFGGYPIYHEGHSLRPFEWLPERARRMLGQWALKLPQGLKGRGYLLRGSERIETRYVGNAKMFSEEEKRQLLPDAAPEMEPYWTVTAPYFAATAGMDPAERMQTVDAHTWLPGDILMKADKMSMAHSLELRVPFLDVAVFELASTIPASLKLGQGTTKLALRRAMQPDLPQAQVERPKLGFPVPTSHWIHGPMEDVIHDMLQPAHLPYIDAHAVQALWDAPAGAIARRDRKIWTLLILSLWHQAFLGHPQRGTDHVEEA